MVVFNVVGRFRGLVDMVMVVTEGGGLGWGGGGRDGGCRGGRRDERGRWW
jgi:hypothetical protein